MWRSLSRPLRLVFGVGALLCVFAIGLLVGLALGLWAAIIWEIGAIALVIAMFLRGAIAREKRDRPL